MNDGNRRWFFLFRTTEKCKPPHYFLPSLIELNHSRNFRSGTFPPFYHSTIATSEQYNQQDFPWSFFDSFPGYEMSNPSSGNLSEPQLHEFQPRTSSANPTSQAHSQILPPTVHSEDTIVEQRVVLHQPQPVLGYGLAYQELGLERTSTPPLGPLVGESSGWEDAFTPSLMDAYGPEICSGARPHTNDFPTIPESDALVLAPIIHERRSEAGSTPAFDDDSFNELSLIAVLNSGASHGAHPNRVLCEEGPSSGTEVSTDEEDESYPRRIAALPKSKFPPPHISDAQHLLPAPKGRAITRDGDYPSQVNTSQGSSSTLGKRKMIANSFQNPRTKRARRQERENIDFLPIADDQGRIICQWDGCGGRFNTREELHKHCMGAKSTHHIPSGKGIKVVCPYCGGNVSAVWRHVMEIHFRIPRSG